MFDLDRVKRQGGKSASYPEAFSFRVASERHASAFGTLGKVKACPLILSNGATGANAGIEVSPSCPECA
jgi:hypothetical protein